MTLQRIVLNYRTGGPIRCIHGYAEGMECVKKASIKAASSKATWEELASEGGRDPLETLAAGREVD